MLLINARYDPNTGYQGAVNVSKQLSNAVLLTLDGYGHVTSHDPSACIEKARVAYIVDLVVPPAGTVCARPQALRTVLTTTLTVYWPSRYKIGLTRVHRVAVMETTSWPVSQSRFNRLARPPDRSPRRPLWCRLRLHGW